MDTSNQFTEPLLVSETEILLAQAVGSNHGGGQRSITELLTLLEMAVDFVTTTGTLMLSYSLYTGFHLGKQIHYPHHIVAGFAFLYSAFNVGMLQRNGVYRPDNSLLSIRETERILRASTETFVAGLCLSLFASYLVSRWLVVFALLLVPFFLMIEKRLTVAGISVLHDRGYAQRRVVIFGAGQIGRRIFSVLLRSPKLGLEPVAIFDDSCSGKTIFEASYNRRRSITVSEGMPTAQALREHRAQMVLIADPLISQETLSEIAEEALSVGATISFVPSNFVRSDYWVDYIQLDGIFLASLEQIRAGGEYEFVKRMFDIVLGSCLLVLILPFLVGIALAIRISSSGPIFFIHERVGKDGKRFRMFKFRTMHADADPYAVCPKEQADPRISNIGRILRRTSFDELPQLLNVILGDMSLVGPRPEMPFIVSEYNALQRQRLVVKPGLTGLWQLSADRKSLIHENLDYDLYYIRNRGFFMDLAVLFHTVIFAMRGI